MAITKIQSESLNLSDTYAFTVTVTGAGGVNTPAFSAKMSSGQDIGYSGVWTKLNFTSEQFDIGSYYNAGNAKFTPFWKIFCLL